MENNIKRYEIDKLWYEKLHPKGVCLLLQYLITKVCAWGEEDSGGHVL
jgi:hypothetical protein